MNQVDPNVVILNQAWALLWDPTSKFYLPTVLQNGGSFGNTTLPPMTQVALDDMDSIPLYSSNTWGDVEISLTGLNLSGLPSVQNQSFTPAPDASSVSGTVAFGSLTFSGLYEVLGSGLVGCAMDIARTKATPPPGGAGASAGPPPSNMDLARQYRDQLVAQSGNNGITLVSTYYDHNDTINTILNQNNPFTRAWPLATPSGPGLNTAHYMGVTNTAAQNPTSPDYQVGDEGYNIHGYYMQTLLLRTAELYANGSTDPENPYVALQNAIVGFKCHTMKHQQPMTVGAVMDTVQNTDQQCDPGAMVEHDLARRGREMAERDFAMWHNQAMAAEAARVGQATTYRSNGAFVFDFGMPTVTFNGTVAISGIPPQQTMTVTLTSLTAAIPNVDIELLSGTDPTFTADAQDHIHDAIWFQKTIGLRLNAKLGSPKVLNYLSSLFNQAINSLG
jgi:hypothetical protein